MNALEIAKRLTADNLTALHEQRIIEDPRTLEKILQVNRNRTERTNNEDIFNEMTGVFTLRHAQIPEIAPAIVNPKRIRALMKTELWREYKEAFCKEHIQLVAKEEAAKFVNRTYPSKKN